MIDTGSDPASQEAQPEAAALFVSDVHLQPGLPRTTALFLDFLERHAVRCRQLYLLGDLFEYWAGDDDLIEPYHADIARRLRSVAEAGVRVFWIGGNRDFLIGADFANAAGLTLLSDPHDLVLGNLRLTLAHGDAQCTDDVGYMQFRRQVRESTWQQHFLSKPLAERKQIISGMRAGSRDAQREKSMTIMDVNPDAVHLLVDAHRPDVLIHGHTHRPACHRFEVNGRPVKRLVLPDWDADGGLGQVRGGWIALGEDLLLRRYDAFGRMANWDQR